jgi:hypothetical protein
MNSIINGELYELTEILKSEGIDIFDDDGNCKSFAVVLFEISNIWETL